MSKAGVVRRILAEPLFHFVLIGLVLFLVHDAMGGDSGPESTRIVVDAELVDSLAQRHMLLWQRAPSEEEMAGLIEAHIREEIFYREGIAAGLDGDDEIIRRRVRQKLEVLAEETGDMPADQENEIKRFFGANSARYAEPARLSFEQIFFDSTRRGRGAAEQGARDALRKLRAPSTGGSVSPGDPSLLPNQAEQRRPAEIAAEFSAEFARALEALPLDDWDGPIASPYGFHLVRVVSRMPGKVPPLVEVREAVERDWESQRRRDALEAYYRKVRANYDIVMDETLPRSAEKPL
jgi:peptidyl-prolyl cis-trans isomerase C